MRKLNWFLRLIYNFVRICILSTIYHKHFKSNYYSLLSPVSHLKLNSKGRIYIGRKCMIDDGTLVRASGGEIIIEDNVYINRNCNIVSKSLIHIKSGVTIGPNVCIYDHNHSVSIQNSKKYVSEKTIIGENVWIGANAVILKGVKIGSNSIIGAGSIVTKDIGESKIYYNELKNMIKDLPY